MSNIPRNMIGTTIADDIIDYHPTHTCLVEDLVLGGNGSRLIWGYLRIGLKRVRGHSAARSNL